MKRDSSWRLAFKGIGARQTGREHEAFMGAYALFLFNSNLPP